MNHLLKLLSMMTEKNRSRKYIKTCFDLKTKINWRLDDDWEYHFRTFYILDVNRQHDI